ncbi:MAG: hypothetical protein ACRDQZ_20015, partial [Mycobacteriales bacterium]
MAARKTPNSAPVELGDGRVDHKRRNPPELHPSEVDHVVTRRPSGVRSTSLSPQGEEMQFVLLGYDGKDD